MTKTELKKVFLEKGIECSHLDDVVHDAASSKASDANNGGLDTQLEFLLSTCEWTPQDILNALEIK
jgi:hypothetical protein